MASRSITMLDQTYLLSRVKQNSCHAVITQLLTPTHIHAVYDTHAHSTEREPGGQGYIHVHHLAQ